MFTITHNKHTGLHLQNATGATFPVGELTDLIALHHEIGQYLQQRGKTEYISTFRARQLALKEGHNILTNSITSACAHGTIANAKKKKGRWQMPLASWEQWYTEWKIRHQAKQAANDK